MPAADAPHLLLVKPGSFGDVIHALPCAAALKRAHPAARLTWLVDERWRGLLAGNPFVDGLVAFPRQSFRGLGGKVRSLFWARRLRDLAPTAALDLQGLLRSALMARLSGARRIVGLSDAREGAGFFYHAAARVQPPEHAVDRYLRTLPLLDTPVPAEPEFWLPEGEPVATPAAPYVLLHPFARGAGKSLAPEAVAALCAALAPLPVVLAGQGDTPDGLGGNVTNLLHATSLGQLIHLIRRAAFVVSVDSGPMHIAAAVGAPLLSIHTWSDPRLVGPYHRAAWIWQGGLIWRQDFATAHPGGAPAEADLRAIADLVRREARL